MYQEAQRTLGTIWPGVAGASGAVARSSSVAPPRDDVVHDTSPQPPEAGQDLTRCGLSPAPPFKGTWFRLVATIPHQRRSPPAGCFAVSSHTVAFGGIRFCSLLAHGRFRRRSLLYSISAHGRLWQRPPFSQPSRAPLRRLLIHDRLWQLSPYPPGPPSLYLGSVILGRPLAPLGPVWWGW